MNYNIEGEPLPVVICNLEANETMITEKGAMSWMTPNMKMETTSNGGIGKMFGRAFSGESMFQNRYTSMGGPGMIAFASCFPGCIRPFQIAPGQEIIAQKSAFLASTSGVELSVFFQKRIGAGFFGGEGFIMQRLSGNGFCSLHKTREDVLWSRLSVDWLHSLRFSLHAEEYPGDRKILAYVSALRYTIYRILKTTRHLIPL